MLSSGKVEKKTERRQPELPIIRLDSIIKTSTLYDEEPAAQNQKIIDAFNRDSRGDITVESVQFGKRIDQDEFRLVHRNNAPQLVPFTYYPRRLQFNLTGVTKEIGIFKQTDLIIGAHGRFVVNVPQGKIAKAWLGKTEPVLLGAGPHVIHHPNFRLDETPLVNISEPYIAHGNYHILRVPRGTLAKIWIGSTPYLLESQSEPYIFDDPTVKVESTNIPAKGIQYFTTASERYIEHGSIKRLLPRTGEAAITYDNGKLRILEATGEPITIDDPTFVVDGFLQTAAQTLVFPSKKTQEERRRANPKDADNYDCEEFRTSDGLPIGVNLLVVYEIFDPKITLTRLKKDDIINHIENIVVADMGRVIQSCSSSDFQKSSQTEIKDATRLENQPIFQSTSVPTFYAHLQDEVKNKLAEDLKDWGIRLVRLNIETPKILDKTIAEEMSKNSLVTAKSRADVSTLSLDYTIKQQRANQEAEKKRIEMERERENKILVAKGESESLTIRAQGELDAAKLKADAERIEYENKIRKEQMTNEVALKKIEIENALALKKIQMEYDMKLKFLQESAKVYSENESFRQMEISKGQNEALRGISTSVISPEVAQSWFSGIPGLSLFAPRGAATSLPAANTAEPKKLEIVDTARKLA